jgi:hypothetical protein
VEILDKAESVESAMKSLGVSQEDYQKLIEYEDGEMDTVVTELKKELGLVDMAAKSSKEAMG